MTAIGCVRVSTEDQGKEGHGQPFKRHIDVFVGGKHRGGRNMPGHGSLDIIFG
jgi:hypothetical protein